MVFTTVELSKILVKERILGKRRNNQSMNYEHSLRVYARLKKYTSDEEVLLAGLLHDILEDSDTTSSELKDLGYTQRTIDLIEGCSHDKIFKTPNEQWYNMMLDIVSKSSKEVRLIKVVDTMDNLSDPIPDLENSLRYKQFIKKGFSYLIYAEPYLGDQEVFKDFKNVLLYQINSMFGLELPSL